MMGKHKTWRGRRNVELEGKSIAEVQRDKSNNATILQKLDCQSSLKVSATETTEIF
jgi:hypothetical protein